jgi:hypothetical protein
VFCCCQHASPNRFGLARIFLELQEQGASGDIVHECLQDLGGAILAAVVDEQKAEFRFVFEGSTKRIDIEA